MPHSGEFRTLLFCKVKVVSQKSFLTKCDSSDKSYDDQDKEFKQIKIRS